MTDLDSSQAADMAGMPFDQLVGELQRIVQALEGGNLPLEDGISMYRRGLQLHAACEARLREAELTITQLGRGVVAAGAEAVEEADA